MTSNLGPIATALASIVALGIAVWNARRSDRQREQDRRAAVRARQADQLAQLLTMYTSFSAPTFLVRPLVGQEPSAVNRNNGAMKAILLTLPGHFATVLRIHLGLNYTVTGVPLDAASRARLRDDEDDAGHKWLIFDRASAITNRGFKARSEWIEAELAYDIEGLLGGDQEAVLAALKRYKSRLD